MKVEIWSDFVCPFCYIGKRKFEQALSQFSHKNNVEIIYRSFELDPTAQKGEFESVNHLLASRYGMSVQEAQAANDNVNRQAETVGLTYRMDRIPANTFNAHRLMHFASTHGKMVEMTERILYAHFTESKDISDFDTLSILAEDIGLNRSDAKQILISDQYAKDVRADEQDATNLGIRGVPFFVIDRKYGVSGAQPTDAFLDALQKAWNEANPLTLLNDDDSNQCVDGACAPAPKN